MSKWQWFWPIFLTALNLASLTTNAFSHEPLRVKLIICGILVLAIAFIWYSFLAARRSMARLDVLRRQHRDFMTNIQDLYFRRYTSGLSQPPPEDLYR